MLDYLRSGKSQAETALHFGVTRQAVSYACGRYGLPQRRAGYAKQDFTWGTAKVRQLREWWSKGISTAEIGRRLGVSKDAVIGKARRLGLGPHPCAPNPTWRDNARQYA